MMAFHVCFPSASGRCLDIWQTHLSSVLNISIMVVNHLHHKMLYWVLSGIGLDSESCDIIHPLITVNLIWSSVRQSIYWFGSINHQTSTLDVTLNPQEKKKEAGFQWLEQWRVAITQMKALNIYSTIDCGYTCVRARAMYHSLLKPEGSKCYQ